MSNVTIRPAQSNDFHALQAMSCGLESQSCYPGFVAASHKFFVAVNGYNVVGFICAYPGVDNNARYVQMMQPYTYSSLLKTGVEDQLKAAVLEWAETKMDIHFFKEDPFTLHAIKPHEYLQSLKYEPDNSAGPDTAQTLAEPTSQGNYISDRAYALG